MTTTLVRPAGPFTPESRGLVGSIFDVAEVREGLGFVDTTGLIESFNCIGYQALDIECDEFTDMTKQFDPPAISDGFQFVVQGGVECKPFGFEGNDPRAKAAWAAAEATGVSQGLHDWLVTNATDATPAATAVTPAQGLAILEGQGYATYAGVPVIHAGPAMVSQWSQNGAVERVGNQLQTRLGTAVVASAGYETKTGGKVDDEQWGFVTGAVLLVRSELIDQNQLDRSTNELRTLFERLYIAAFDCLTVKVKVQVL